VAKLGIITAGLDAGQDVLVGVAIVGSLLTLVSMMKIWLSAFWGTPAPVASTVGAAAAEPITSWPISMTSATVALVGVGLALALAAGPLYALCERAASDVTTPGRYAAEVMGQ
jgi:multicomponent Na+:H+ antiporter subunit D